MDSQGREIGKSRKQAKTECYPGIKALVRGQKNRWMGGMKEAPGVVSQK
jgi:hypothetical protein